MISVYNLYGEGKHVINGEEVKVSLFDLKKQLYLAMMSVNILEAIRFYVSFACSFAFAERELMEGNAKIIKLIARDEALHLSGTQHILNIMQEGKDDPEMAIVAAQCREEAIQMFVEAAEQEKDWAEYLFKDGSMIGLNKDILCQYVEYITNARMTAVGLPAQFESKSNPIPWINSWLVSDNVQVAPQEAEISSYLVGQIDSQVDASDFGDFDL
jgi:ribonucleoside-diphosphate reductase beta chain